MAFDYTNLAFFAFSCLALVVSGSFFVDSLITIAKFIRMKEYIAGFIVLGLSTSLPELFVGINSALANVPALSLGTVIGSNIADLALIGGITSLLARGIKIEHKGTIKDSYTAFAIAFFAMLLMFIGNSLSRMDGILLVIAFCLYCAYIIRGKWKSGETLDNQIGKWKIILAVFIFIISFVVLYLSSEMTVRYGERLAIDMLLPPIFIGLFFVAVGTSLPELVVGIRAVVSKHSEINIGNLIGSVVINSTLVLGVTAIITPITANIFLFMTSGVFMIVICFLFATFIQSGEKLDWTEGLALILLYVFFLIVELNLRGFASVA